MEEHTSQMDLKIDLILLKSNVTLKVLPPQKEKNFEIYHFCGASIVVCGYIQQLSVSKMRTIGAMRFYLGIDIYHQELQLLTYTHLIHSKIIIGCFLQMLAL